MQGRGCGVRAPLPPAAALPQSSLLAGLYLQSFVNDRKRRERRKESWEGVGSCPLRITSLLQALQAERLNRLPIRCQANTQAVRAVTALIPKRGHAARHAECHVLGPLYLLPPGCLCSPPIFGRAVSDSFPAAPAAGHPGAGGPCGWALQDGRSPLCLAGPRQVLSGEKGPGTLCHMPPAAVKAPSGG